MAGEKLVLTKRYGLALFELALESDKPSRVRQDLARLVDTAKEVPMLMHGLSDEAVDMKRRVEAARAIARALELGSTVRNLLLLLVSRERVSLLPGVAKDFMARLMHYSRFAHAEVEVAEKVSCERIRKTMEEILQRLLKLQVRCEAHVDPSLIGGFVLRIGDRRFDASVRGRLERMKHELFETAR